MPKHGPLDLVEGFYLAHIVYHLHHRHILEQLGDGKTAAGVAREHGYDADLLGALFDFVYQSSDLLLRDETGRYRLQPAYGSYAQFGFHLDKFMGAYGGTLTRLEDALRDPTLGEAFVDADALAYAFTRVAEVAEAETSLMASLFHEWNVHALLDLGCGPATLLRALCAADPTFRGWGIDVNAAMCNAATEAINRDGLTARLAVFNADVRRLESCLPPDIRAQVDAVHGRSLFNEFFRFGSAAAVDFIETLKRLFPRCYLFVTDYYGKLTHIPTTDPRHKHTVLHDVAQVLSAQGIPPPDLQAWAALYHAAACEVVHAYEGESDGIEWFVHVVQL